MKGCIVIDFREMPEFVALLRCEMARLIVEQAQREPRYVADRLVEVAATFETGGTGVDSER